MICHHDIRVRAGPVIPPAPRRPRISPSASVPSRLFIIATGAATARRPVSIDFVGTSACPAFPAAIRNPQNPRNITFITFKHPETQPPPAASSYTVSARSHRAQYPHDRQPKNTKTPEITLLSFGNRMTCIRNHGTVPGFHHGLLLPSMGRRTKDEGCLYPSPPLSTFALKTLETREISLLTAPNAD